MIRITHDDFKKLLKVLEKEGCGAHMTFRTKGTTLEVETIGKDGRSMVIELADVEYNFMPRVTRTETI